MEKDTRLPVMMEITSMVMDAAEIVKYKLDLPVLEVPQAQEILALKETQL